MGSAGGYDGAAWVPLTEPLRDAPGGPFIDNATRAGFVDLVFPNGQHPFGPREARLDLFLDLRLYDDRLMCGFVGIDLFSTDDMDHRAPFVGAPVDLFVAQPEPQPACE